jgi:hypothetical protein
MIVPNAPSSPRSRGRNRRESAASAHTRKRRRSLAMKRKVPIISRNACPLYLRFKDPRQRRGVQSPTVPPQRPTNCVSNIVHLRRAHQVLGAGFQIHRAKNGLNDNGLDESTSDFPATTRLRSHLSDSWVRRKLVGVPSPAGDGRSANFAITRERWAVGRC